MPLNPSAVPTLRRVFNEGFSVHDIAEPLVSFDGSNAAKDVRSFMEQRGFEVVGVREHGLVVGYVGRSDLTNGQCGDDVRPFDEAHRVDDSTPLSEVVLGLRESPRLFVSLLGQVGGIVTRSDLQKPPVRMWLFGMVTLIEMRITRLIERFLPEDDWRKSLSEGRIAKADQLLAERTRRNQYIDLLDCLQFSDKGQIMARCEQLRKLTRFDSRRQMEQIFKKLERLRNNLAHSQDIITNDWETIVDLSENLDSVLEGPPGLNQAPDARA